MKVKEFARMLAGGTKVLVAEYERVAETRVDGRMGDTITCYGYKTVTKQIPLDEFVEKHEGEEVVGLIAKGWELVEIVTI